MMEYWKEIDSAGWKVQWLVESWAVKWVRMLVGQMAERKEEKKSSCSRSERWGEPKALV